VVGSICNVYFEGDLIFHVIDFDFLFHVEFFNIPPRPNDCQTQTKLSESDNSFKLVPFTSMVWVWTGDEKFPPQYLSGNERLEQVVLISS
jgi:hypothetical protein